ncbi:hypothetical protein ACNQVK_03260 [Mycobacterium sp. 134]
MLSVGDVVVVAGSAYAVSFDGVAELKAVDLLLLLHGDGDVLLLQRGQG